MTKMITTLSKYTDRIKSYIPKHIRTSMLIIYVYAMLLFITILMYIAGWCYKWHMNGAPDTAEVIQFMKEYVSVSMVAAITFISVFSVDKNRDGRPDAAENKSKGGS